MRLLIITNILSPYRERLFVAMSKRVQNLDLLLTAESETNRNWSHQNSELKTKVLPGLHLRRNGRRSDIHLNLGVFSALSQAKPEIVLSGGTSLAVVVASIWCQLNRVPHIAWGELSLEEPASNNILRRISRRIISNLSEGAIGSSQKSCEAFSRIGFEASTIRSSPLAVDTRAIHAIQRDKRPRTQRASAGPLKLCSVAQLIDRKGHELFFRQISQISSRFKQGLHLRIVGDGPLKEELQAQAQSSELSVTFTGHLSEAEVFAIMSDSDFHVFHTLFDTFGVVVQEGMACGVPTIASSRAPATEEYLKHGVNGWVYDPLAPNATQKLFEALSTPLLQRTSISQSALSDALQWDTDASAADLLRHLSSWLHAPRDSRLKGGAAKNV